MAWGPRQKPCLIRSDDSGGITRETQPPLSLETVGVSSGHSERHAFDPRGADPSGPRLCPDALGEFVSLAFRKQPDRLEACHLERADNTAGGGVRLVSARL